MGGKPSRSPFAHPQLRDLTGPLWRGLYKGESATVYSRPASFLVTEIWYLLVVDETGATQWYWTPYDPFPLVEEASWQSVTEVEVKEGHYSGRIPAFPNLQILSALNSGCASLSESSHIMPSEVLKGKSLVVTCVVEDKHPKLFLRDNFTAHPTSETRVHVAHLVYETLRGQQMSVVHLKPTLWKMSHGTVVWKSTLKAYEDIEMWCRVYQAKYPLYTLTHLNCRRFMIELCKFVGVDFSNALVFEDTYYTARDLAETTKVLTKECCKRPDGC